MMSPKPCKVSNYAGNSNIADPSGNSLRIDVKWLQHRHLIQNCDNCCLGHVFIYNFFYPRPLVRTWYPPHGDKFKQFGACYHKQIISVASSP